jgi:hypothetical protein
MQLKEAYIIEITRGLTTSVAFTARGPAKFWKRVRREGRGAFSSLTFQLLRVVPDSRLSSEG